MRSISTCLISRNEKSHPPGQPWETVRTGAYLGMAEYGGNTMPGTTRTQGAAIPRARKLVALLSAYRRVERRRPLGQAGRRADRIQRIEVEQHVRCFFRSAHRSSIHSMSLPGGSRVSTIQAPRQYDGWPVLKKIKGGNIYLSHSPDGVRWNMDPEPFLPFLQRRADQYRLG